ncbi:hypothetical protein ACH5RR_012790 [Cinchona calisaya]|uniref:Uncharacterized protein n=1 Tax=Cinchona calisaya TaxID=153742 RepID=A0ABD3A8R7_9GENT
MDLGMKCNNLMTILLKFVNFTKIMSEHTDMGKREALFALAALMEIPFQYRAAQNLPYKENSASPRRKELPPPCEVIYHDNSIKSFPHMTSFGPVDPGPLADQVTLPSIPAWALFLLDFFRDTI